MAKVKIKMVDIFKNRNKKRRQTPDIEHLSPFYYYKLRTIRLFALFHLSLQLCESVDVTESCRSSHVVDCRSSLLLCCVLASRLNILFCCLECTAVRKDDALCLLNELDNLERKLLTKLSLCAIFLNVILPM